MRARPIIGLLPMLMVLSISWSSEAMAQAMCDRAARAFGMATRALEATTKRWTDCLARGLPCQAEQQTLSKAQNAAERARAEARHQCPDMTY